MDNSILVNEGNVIDLYKKLVAKETIDKTERDEVLKRFFELVNYKSGR